MYFVNVIQLSETVDQDSTVLHKLSLKCINLNSIKNIHITENTTSQNIKKGNILIVFNP